MTGLEAIVDERCTVGEGPLWHPDHELLYWVDIPGGHLFRYDPATGEYEHAVSNDRQLGGFTIEADGTLLLFQGGGAIQRWQAGEGIVETIRRHLPDERASRFNDVVADPAGRVFAGTMPTEDRLGRLYRIDRDGNAAVVERDLAVPNGMDFSRDRSTFYLTVSDEKTIYAYDYDEDTGSLANRRTFVDTGDEAGVPDGLTVDSADHVWSARWDDGGVDRYTPAGTHDRRIDVPPPKASSVTFGGPEYGDLYVTTAVGEGTAADDDSGAGMLYRTRAEVAGVPAFRSRISADV